MDKNLQAAAYRGEPIPCDLSDAERVQYILLRRTYLGFKSGELTQAQGEKLKADILQYDQLPKNQKAALLDDFIGKLYADHESGDVEAFPAIKMLSTQLVINQ